MQQLKLVSFFVAGLVCATGAFAQAPPSPATSELRELIDEVKRLGKRIEALEKRPTTSATDEGKQPSTTKATSGVPAGQRAVQGWRIGIIDWDKEFNTNKDVIQYILAKNGKFDANFHKQKIAGDLYIYKLEGYFRAKKAGRYVFAIDLQCPFGHQCNLEGKLENKIIFKHRDRTSNGIITAGETLQEGVYKYEIAFALARSNFLNFRPETATIRPLIRTEDDLDQRDFQPDELFVLVKGAAAPSADKKK